MAKGQNQKRYKSHPHQDRPWPRKDDLVERLDLWMRDMAGWGRVVRQDILKLEEAVHALERKANLPETAFGNPDRPVPDPANPHNPPRQGDPGDPPDPPWQPGGDG